MKRYKMLGTSQGAVLPRVRKNGEWVSAKVAQDLHDALSLLVKASYERCITPEDRDIAERALASADEPNKSS